MCGVFGIRASERDVARVAYFGLFALQHRGQESAGIAVSDAGRLTVLRDMGRFHEAHEDLSRALSYLRRAGDTIWEARSLTHRAEVFLGLGLPRRAEADFAHAEELFATKGQELEYAKARHNLGQAALVRGDLPQALTYLDEAGKRYEALGEAIPELAIDR